MKKLCLMLLIAISCSVSAKAPLESGVVNTFDYFQVSQAANTSSVFKEIKGDQNKSWQSCVQSCLQEFNFCYFTGPNAGSIYCERVLDACLADCGL